MERHIGVNSNNPNNSGDPEDYFSEMVKKRRRPSSRKGKKLEPRDLPIGIYKRTFKRGDSFTVAVTRDSKRYVLPSCQTLEEAKRKLQWATTAPVAELGKGFSNRTERQQKIEETNKPKFPDLNQLWKLNKNAD